MNVARVDECRKAMILEWIGVLADRADLAEYEDEIIPGFGLEDQYPLGILDGALRGMEALGIRVVFNDGRPIEIESSEKLEDSRNDPYSRVRDDFIKLAEEVRDPVLRNALLAVSESRDTRSALKEAAELANRALRRALDDFKVADKNHHEMLYGAIKKNRDVEAKKGKAAADAMFAEDEKHLDALKKRQDEAWAIRCEASHVCYIIARAQDDVYNWELPRFAVVEQ